MANSNRQTEIVRTWIENTEASDDAFLVKRLVRSAPEIGWLTILDILRQTDGEAHLKSLAVELKLLIVNHGAVFLERIEVEASRNFRFKNCLSMVFSHTGAQIQEELRDRLTLAAGIPIGTMPPKLLESSKLFPVGFE